MRMKMKMKTKTMNMTQRLVRKIGIITHTVTGNDASDSRFQCKFSESDAVAVQPMVLLLFVWICWHLYRLLRPIE